MLPLFFEGCPDPLGHPCLHLRMLGARSCDAAAPAESELHLRVQLRLGRRQLQLHEPHINLAKALNPSCLQYEAVQGWG